MFRRGVEGMAGVEEWRGEGITPNCDFNGLVCFVTARKRNWESRCSGCALVVCHPTTADNGLCAVCFRTARFKQHGWICSGGPCWQIYQQHRQQQREATEGQGNGAAAAQQPMPPPPPPPAPCKAQPQQPPQQQLQQQQSHMATFTSIKQAIQSSKIPHLQSMKSLKPESFQSFKFEKQ